MNSNDLSQQIIKLQSETIKDLLTEVEKLGAAIQENNEYRVRFNMIVSSPSYKLIRKLVSLSESIGVKSFLKKIYCLFLVIKKA